MPKLCDIVKPGVPCRVMKPNRSIIGCTRNGFTVFKWDGDQLRFEFDNSLCVVSLDAFRDDWQVFDEPTVESVLRERGYFGDTYNDKAYYSISRSVQHGEWTGDRPEFKCDTNKRPTTVAQVNEIIDLLEKYR